jgi:hypothetical protein
LLDGNSKFILVHVEVQGNNGHEELGSRMFRYFYRARDKHNVFITAFAILIDDVKSYHPKIYHEEYLGTRLSYEFNTYKLLDQDEEELRTNPNPFAVVALTVLKALKNKNITDEKLKEIKLELTTELMKRKLGHAKHEKIMAFIAYYVNFENPTMMIKFELGETGKGIIDGSSIGVTTVEGVIKIMSKIDTNPLMQEVAKDFSSVLGVAGKVLGVTSAMNDLNNIRNKGFSNSTVADWAKLGASVGQVALKSNFLTIGVGLAYGIADATGNNPIDLVYDRFNKK